MDTSDSEYFESADEDFNSDEEDSQIKSVKNKNPECRLSPTVKTLNNLSVDQDINKNIDDIVSTPSSIVTLEVVDKAKAAISKNSNTDIRCQAQRDTKAKHIQDSDIESDELNNLREKNHSPINHLFKDDIKEVQPPINNITIERNVVKENIKPIESKIKLGNTLNTKVKNKSSVGVKKQNDEIKSKEELTTQKKSDDNLWNDEDGWGVDDKDDKKADEILWGADEINWAEGGTVKENKESGKEGKHLDPKDNMWDNDDWETFEDDKIEQKTARSNAEDNTWGGWSNWGVSSILTTATQSVSTLTNQVSQGISTVLETGMGAPDPEELARLNYAEKINNPQSRANEEELLQDTNSGGFGFGNLGNFVLGVSNFTKLVESTGTKVISGGLDTLETIGKKTMEVLQDGDPGLKKKRAFLKLDQDKPVLSQVLREAKEKAEVENKIRQEKHFSKKMNYETLFDDHQGLVHLEALEMLSKQCDIKLQTLTESSLGEASIELQETMEQVKELCELPDEEEDELISLEELKDKLKSAVTDININITYDKLISTWEETESWLNNLNLNICDERELHQQAIETLAQLTAIAVEQFHKAGELLLVKEHRSTADESDSLVQLTTTLTALIGMVAAKFSEKLNAKASETSNKEDINGLITNVFFEAANSTSYMQDAFQLLIPVLQVGAV